MFGNKKNEVESTDLHASKLNSIEKGTVIIGEVETAGNFRVEGKVKGNIACKSRLVIGNNGVVEGTVTCKDAHVLGTFKGEIKVEGTIHLAETAIFEGNIVTQKIRIESGAVFTGTWQYTQELHQGIEAYSIQRKWPATRIHRARSSFGLTNTFNIQEWAFKCWPLS